MDEAQDASNDIDERVQARIGRVLKEKWRIDSLLGVGGMAAVYAATHRNGSRAAIKMLHVELSMDGEVKRRFLREGYVANSVAHPGAVRVIDDDVAEDGSVFIVMDLLEGETLDRRCRRFGGSLPPEELLPLVDQLLDVLAAAHDKGIVHRDIKPENVFVTREGQVKLLDFGIARLRTFRPGSVATVTGSLFGTPAYMPPEQALGRTEQIDAQSDLWAVGAMMFSLSAGRMVHEAQTLNEQLVAHAAKPAPSLASVKQGAPRVVVGIVDRALAFDKAKRWVDAKAMQSAVRTAMEQLGFPGRKPSGAPDEAAGVQAGSPGTQLMLTMKAPEPPSKARTSTIAAVGGLALVLIAVVAVLLFRSSDGGSTGTPGASAPSNAPPTAVQLPPPALPTNAVPTAEQAAPSPPNPTEAAQPSVSPRATASAKAPVKPTSGKAAGAGSGEAKPEPQGGGDDWLDRQH